MKIKLLSNLATIPTHGSEYAAGYDLYAAIPETTIIPAHKTEKIPTDIAMEIPKGFAGLIMARSGLATKEGLRPANCVGLIDSDYRGNVIVALHNDTNTNKTIDPDERIAQLVIIPFESVEFEVVDELSDTIRAEGGFGSTGT